MKTLLLNIYNWFTSNKILAQQKSKYDAEIEILKRTVDELEQSHFNKIMQLGDQFNVSLLDRDREIEHLKQKVIQAVDTAIEIKTQYESKLQSITKKYDISQERVSLLQLKLDLRPKK